MKRRLREAMLFPLLRLLQRIERRPLPLDQLRPSEINNILVVASTAIGDTLLSTPGIRAVRQHYPGARIVALLNAQNRQLFENNPDLDCIVSYHGGYHRFWRTVWKLRNFQIDLALVFHGNEPQATPLCFLAGARFIVKLPNSSDYRFLLSNVEPVLKWEDFSHGVDQRMKVAELVGCRATERRMVLTPAMDEAGAVERFLTQHGVDASQALIGFQVGASTLSRMWFPEKFVELGKRIAHAVPEARVIITGSPQERRYATGIADAIGTGVVVAAGNLTLRQLPILVRQLRLLVTGDTGTMHLAVAVGTPVVALFAVSDAQRSGPAYDLDRHTVIQKHRTCRPCISKRCQFQVCMENITVDEVFDAIMYSLDRETRIRRSGAV